MSFRKPPPWDREKALRVAQSNAGVLIIDWRWRMDQRRGVCQRARKDGLLRKITHQIVVDIDGRKRRIKMPAGSDTFELTDAGRQWLNDHAHKKREMKTNHTPPQ